MNGEGEKIKHNCNQANIFVVVHPSISTKIEQICIIMGTNKY